MYLFVRHACHRARAAPTRYRTWPAHITGARPAVWWPAGWSSPSHLAARWRVTSSLYHVSVNQSHVPFTSSHAVFAHRNVRSRSLCETSLEGTLHDPVCRDDSWPKNGGGGSGGGGGGGGGGCVCGRLLKRQRAVGHRHFFKKGLRKTALPRGVLFSTRRGHLGPRYLQAEIHLSMHLRTIRTDTSPGQAI